MEEIQRALFVAQISNDSDALYLLEKLLIQLIRLLVNVKKLVITQQKTSYNGLSLNKEKKKINLRRLLTT